MGLVGPLGLYIVGRSLAVPRGLAALGVATWALAVDWLWLEHQLLTETLATTLLVATLVVVVGAPRPHKRRLLWAVGIGVAAAILAMGAGLVRPALFAALPGVGLCVLLLADLPARSRVVGTGVLVVCCGLILAGYLQVQERKTHFTGLIGSSMDLGDIQGWRHSPSAGVFACRLARAVSASEATPTAAQARTITTGILVAGAASPPTASGAAHGSEAVGGASRGCAVGRRAQ